MWRGKAAAGLVCLAVGCAPVQQLRQGASPQARQEVDVELVGCLLAGTAPGTFVLTDVANPDRPREPRQAVDVMSTRVGLTAHVGRRVGVRGYEQPAPKGTIYEVGRVFRIRTIAELGEHCEQVVSSR
jgi:hypothetical protein